jgi:membrane protease YdiL (CAAX protease family)
MSWDVVLILLLLGVVVPWRGFVRMRHLLAKPQVGSSERILIYLGTIAFQWLAALVAAWRASAHGWSKFELGLVLLGDRNVLVAGIVGAAIVTLLQGVNLRRMSRLPPESRARLGALAERILPQTPRERPLFVLLALTAGGCEEFLYRGFAMTAFSRAGLPVWSSILISSVLFGLGHLYQGGRGAAGTAILGMAFGMARTAFGSILPVACWHAAADVIAGMAGPKYLAGKPVTSSSTTSSDH